MVKTRTAVTEHGSVEYEVVKCASCNQEVAANDAKEILIADEIKPLSMDYAAYRDATQANICPYCIEGNNLTSLSLDVTSRRSIGRSLISAALTVLLAPRNPTKEILERRGLDELDASFGSTLALVAWWVTLAVGLFILGSLGLAALPLL